MIKKIFQNLKENRTTKAKTLQNKTLIIIPWDIPNLDINCTCQMLLLNSVYHLEELRFIFQIIINIIIIDTSFKNNILIGMIYFSLFKSIH